MVNVNKVPVTRLCKGGLERVDSIVREPDKRTFQELKDTITAYSEYIPEVRKFAEEIKRLPQKDVGIIADTIEISQHSQFLAADVNLNREQTNGATVLENLIRDMIRASEFNPDALKLVESIINNTDVLTSKFALYIMSGGALLDSSVAEQMKETAKVVPDIARNTLRSHDVFDFSERMDFVTSIRKLALQEVIPEKIVSFYRDIMSFGKYIPEKISADRDVYVKSDVPMEKIKENLKVLPQIFGKRDKSAGRFNVVDFVLNNTNLI